jgi:hypothetical protein
MSTLKVDTITTISGTGNINLSRPIAGDGSNLTGVAPTKTTIEALGIDLPAANLTGTVADARFPATLPASSGVNLTALNASNISSGTLPAGRYTDTVYTHPTTAGNKHIPTAGATDQVLTYSSSGTASWAAPAAGGNSPRWWADFGSDQTLTSGTVTRITGFPATGGVADGGGYTNSRFTVPAGQAGDYIIGANLSFHDSGGDIIQAHTKFYKNGSWYYGGYSASWNNSTNGAVHWGIQAIMIATLAVGDYIDVYGQCVGTGTVRSFTNDGGNQRFTNFWGFKIG